ncbi:betaine-aldehyde dehydrogenase [Rhodoligotrophos appendicifer]|uniref:betaine-aldehyde dehydrogenase n=1 Tax=Rhodoligotrophos appendicifer TaxID=987056 RepID=UPI001960B0AD|nr:betaine-aldehyde dehydrogenase [Rhodoligotrophos appendicifer]
MHSPTAQAALSETSLKNYIGGRYVNSAGNEQFNALNPATGEIICNVQQASEADLEAALASAQAGFQLWRKMTGAERGRILRRAADLLRERNDELATLEVLNTGKPIQEAIAVDIYSGADCLEFFGGVAASIHGHHYQFGANFAYTRREPLGVCAGIGAWNYPIQIACWKSAPALACGNAMIFKPAEMSPLTAAKLAEIYTEAGLPAGVFNVVQGDASVGQWLTRSAGIAKVSLTGELSTGKKVLAAAAETLKHVTLELGGKSPIIVFEDADLDSAVSGAILGNFYTQGEICSNGTRVFVQKSVLEEFLGRMASHAKRIRIGNPLDPQTQMGALISPEHGQKVMEFIERGKSEGARLICGGQRAMVQGCEAGWFIEPTVFADCRDDMTIVKEEIFGPVMSVLSFEEEAEVISRSNDTIYGLSAGVFTRDLARGHRVAAALEAGTCWINTYNVTPVELPFGGYKQSGMGRENSLAAIEHYTQIKTVYVETDKVQSPY